MSVLYGYQLRPSTALEDIASLANPPNAPLPAVDPVDPVPPPPIIPLPRLGEPSTWSNATATSFAFLSMVRSAKGTLDCVHMRHLALSASEGMTDVDVELTGVESEIVKALSRGWHHLFHPELGVQGYTLTGSGVSAMMPAFRDLNKFLNYQSSHRDRLFRNLLSKEAQDYRRTFPIHPSVLDPNYPYRGGGDDGAYQVDPMQINLRLQAASGGGKEEGVVHLAVGMRETKDMTAFKTTSGEVDGGGFRTLRWKFNDGSGQVTTFPDVTSRKLRVAAHQFHLGNMPPAPPPMPTKALSLDELLSPVFKATLVISWSGGVGPYLLRVHEGFAPASPALLEFGNQAGSSVSWCVGLDVGTKFVLRLQDTLGCIVHSVLLCVQSSADLAETPASASRSEGEVSMVSEELVVTGDPGLGRRINEQSPNPSNQSPSAASAGTDVAGESNKDNAGQTSVLDTLSKLQILAQSIQAELTSLSTMKGGQGDNNSSIETIEKVAAEIGKVVVNSLPGARQDSDLKEDLDSLLLFAKDVRGILGIGKGKDVMLAQSEDDRSLPGIHAMLEALSNKVIDLESAVIGLASLRNKAAVPKGKAAQKRKARESDGEDGEDQGPSPSKRSRGEGYQASTKASRARQKPAIRPSISTNNRPIRACTVKIETLSQAFGGTGASGSADGSGGGSVNIESDSEIGDQVRGRGGGRGRGGRKST